MGDFAFTTGQLVHQGSPMGDGSFSSNMAYNSHKNYYTQHSPTSQIIPSPSMTERHDSMYTLSPSQPSRCSVVQQHKAEFQPDAAGLTPHMNSVHNQHSEDMSRETSRTSFVSSMSSDPQYNNGQTIPIYQNDLLPNSTDMRRTVSMYADITTPQNQHFEHYPLQHQMYADRSDLGLHNMYASNLPIAPQHSSQIAPFDDSVIDYQSHETTGMDFQGFEFGNFGHPAR